MHHRTFCRFGVRGLVAAVITALTVASCSTSSSQPSGQTGSPSSHPATSGPHPSPSGGGSSSIPVACPGGWRTGTATVTHQVSVPPVPVATAIRTGTHSDCGFDRLVIDVNGPLPGYKVSFVSAVIQDASGKTITMPGTSFLEIRLNPAQGHQDNGAPTLPTSVRLTGYPMLRSYAVAGDFEGVLTIALGLAGGSRYRVGELPGRIYVDVPWRPTAG